jgi:hypothetical protein
VFERLVRLEDEELALARIDLERLVTGEPGDFVRMTDYERARMFERG